MGKITEENKFAVPADVDVVLQKTAQTYRKDLIKMPTHGMAKSLKYMTLRPGIRASETVGELIADAQFGPYNETRKTDAGVKIVPRTLEVFLGNVTVPFSPNSVYSTVWGANTLNGEALKNVPIALQVLQLIALRLGKHLDQALFKAVRNASGDKSVDLFYGFDTIAKAELTNNKLSDDLGNLVKVSDILGDNQTINSDNAVDFAQGICEAADDELMNEEKLYLYVPQTFVNLYNKAFEKRFGSIPYNSKYDHNNVIGFENVEFAVLGNKKDAPFFQLTTKSNMLVGVNEAINSDAEKVEVGKYDSWQLTYAAAKIFGVQYESINKERALFVTDDGSKPLIQKSATAKGSNTVSGSSDPVDDGEGKE